MSRSAGQGPIAAIVASGGGFSTRVALRALEKLRHECRLFDAAQPFVDDFETFLFFSPTYGDAELHDSLESFLRRLALRDRRYGICELGNYYGYEEPEFGSARILRAHLGSLGWREIFPTLSLDSLPEPDWRDLDRWVARLNELEAR